eukprot:COSAG01_NODE_68013_length_265_cov_0.837349_1_plen_34_part_01
MVPTVLLALALAPAAQTRKPPSGWSSWNHFHLRP